MRNLITFLLLAFFAVPAMAQAPAIPAGAAKNTLVVLAYHDVRDDVRGNGGDHDPDATSSDKLVAHFDWLRAHHYNVVTLQQVVDASNGGAALPDRPVLLTFDDGLESFYSRVYPLLRAYNYPAVAALVGSWIDMPAGKSMPYNGATCDRHCFLTWDQVKEIQRSGLVEFASHSYDLHHGVNANPQGNQLPAATSAMVTPDGKTYEDEAAYTARIRADLKKSADEIEANTGHRPRAIVWPYGSYNRVATKIAADVGMPVSMSLGDALPSLDPTRTIPRLLVSGNVGAVRLAWLMRHQSRIDPTRAVQVDLDYVYDPDPAQQEKNLSRLLDRIKRLHPSQVWLQAYADPDGDGVADAVYFPNRHLPMRADLYSRVEWQLRTRAGVRVFAWLPVMAFRFPDGSKLPALGPGGPKDTDHYRLAPWDPAVRAKIGDVYEDLARHADAAGILFSDDAYLRDTDNLGPWAQDTAAQRTQRLIDFTNELTERVKRWRPQVLTARNIYARPVVDPAAESWFAQSLPAFNAAYNITAIMAMPQLDKESPTDAWFRRLLKAVTATPGSLDRTLFEVATQDWVHKKPIPTEDIAHRLRLLQAGGARHIGYYPDDFIGDHPKLEVIRPAISASDYPYPLPAR
ncbi:biofilm PGA synthesis lipoprotein PgaB [Luteibacter sp. Sphag1AF]|uniref:poly-beta-1,6-N-acetyl-D-glucosamine N-deacetylase PgaB n=1 Tax=Luteibacter sp. Sphag1AF TaxID=2587031 RepID=UPI001839E1CF|nr:poly-beta-1,6-N-acetyl-D-glucosamine N-deacetylase PgaB [Luteibacter sp. Sphag1AF]MBB3228642.1 biofilm PGA synthesis lipoprotein PgaB [Luteibacter sp. Sphag1AF]